MTGNATMTGRATGRLKNGPKYRFLALCSCWMVLYGPKRYLMIRAYRCVALDTPLAYNSGKKGLLGPKRALSSCRMALYGPIRWFMIRAYRCVALDTPLAYIRGKKIRGPPKGLLGPKRAL